ncbi:MAG: deoxynucleoside kinase [Verrucomicrobiaceae bacterium]|nr:deoxynucleoside kinase [Verrucomicrobiaceae bacterium]
MSTESNYSKVTPPPRFIAVEGPVGVGKTTLAKRLADSFNHQILLEQAENNPFLERFYRNPRQNALATQLFFLFQRAQQLQDWRQGDLFEPARVTDFLIAKDRLFARINLEADEYALYEKVYQQLTFDAPRPDLVIYLQASTDVLLQRIRVRGVGYEQSIEQAYLEKINAAYSEFFLYYDDAPLLIVNAAQIDFANSDRDFALLLEQVAVVRHGRHYFNPTFL